MKRARAKAAFVLLRSTELTRIGESAAWKSTADIFADGDLSTTLVHVWNSFAPVCKI